MAQIQVNQLSFYYEGSSGEIFKDVSFSIDTSWKLGFIGRNGRGKTTFLNLLLGKYEYQGSISSSEEFEYFPFKMGDPKRNTIELIEELYPDYELWKLVRELNLMELDSDALYRPFETLSRGEQTKVMLAILFLKEHKFLLLDEPTNHLDAEARRSVSRYLNKKSGFILVSHDRIFLDSCIDHVLSINKNTIEVTQGNFSSWWENKKKRDEFEARENAKLRKEISRLNEAARQAEGWSDQIEKTKLGTRNGGLRPDRGFIGHKAAKMMKRAKSAENRLERAAEEKGKLLKDVETVKDLKIIPLRHYKDVLVSFQDASLSYKREMMQTDGGENEKLVCQRLSLELLQGERLVLQGKNGCGKSTVIKAILAAAGQYGEERLPVLKEGRIETASGLILSYVSQDTSWLSGSINEFTKKYGLDDTLFRAILRKLDFSREHFSKEMGYYSQGQKKKVLLAKSLCEKAHLYIWDEPLNFIDIFSRMQIEMLIKKYSLTMILVEHDQGFTDQIATKRHTLYNLAES